LHGFFFQILSQYQPIENPRPFHVLCFQEIASEHVLTSLGQSHGPWHQEDAPFHDMGRDILGHFTQGIGT
jgi:hypothetical protein